MKFIRKSIAFAGTAVAAFFEADLHPVLTASDLDFYRFNREARMHEAWGSECAGAVGRIGSDPIRPATTARFGHPSRASNRALIPYRHKRSVPISPHSRRKLGLAFGGGFVRAMAHIGVLKVLEEERIPVDLIAGTSAGAVLGAAYCAGISANEIEEMAAAAASCACPGMFPPIEVEGRALIDGMLAYSVPTTPLREMGAEFVIGVHLSADRPLRRAPRHIFELMGQCFFIAEAKISDLWKKDADLVVQPDINGFSFDCFHRAKELIANGEKATRAALPELQRLLRLSETDALSI